MVIGWSMIWMLAGSGVNLSLKFGVLVEEFSAHE
jgi:hypothetical protein